jgi:hypothetical protein
VLVILHIVIDHEDIALIDLLKEPEPGEVPGLENADDHASFLLGIDVRHASFNVLNVQLLKSLPPALFRSAHDFPVIMLPRAVFPVRAITAQFYLRPSAFQVHRAVILERLAMQMSWMLFSYIRHGFGNIEPADRLTPGAFRRSNMNGQGMRFPARDRALDRPISTDH